MQSIPSTSQPWFGLSPTRCHQIINDQLKGMPVDLTWYESLCDFLNQCFSCCSTPLTHAAIDRAVRGLVSAQIRISDLIKDGSGKYSLDSVCTHEIRKVCEHARKLASLVKDNSRSSGIKIMVKPEQCAFEVAVKSGREIGIAITNAKGEPLFMLAREPLRGTGSMQFNMVTIPDSKKNLPQKAIRWVTSNQINHCKHIEEICLDDPGDLNRFLTRHLQQ